MSLFSSDAGKRLEAMMEALEHDAIHDRDTKPDEQTARTLLGISDDEARIFMSTMMTRLIMHATDDVKLEDEGVVIDLNPMQLCSQALLVGLRIGIKWQATLDMEDRLS
jgi:hypothetical protein